MNLLSPTLSDAVNTPGTLKGSSLQKKQTKLPRDHVLELWTHSCGSTPYGTGKKTTHGHGLECGSTSYRTGKTGRELSKLQTSSSRGLRWCRSVPCRTGDYKWHHLSYLCGSCNWKCWEVMVVFSHRTGKTGMDYLSWRYLSYLPGGCKLELRGGYRNASTHVTYQVDVHWRCWEVVTGLE